MELQSLVSTFFDISIGILFGNILLKFFLVKRYYRQNGNNELTDEQKNRIKKISLPITSIALALGVTAIILYIIYLSR